MDKPSNNMLNSFLPFIPNPDRQCQLAYGVKSKAKPGSDLTVRYDSLKCFNLLNLFKFRSIFHDCLQISCKLLSCEAKQEFYMSYADGTYCDIVKWCHHGHCIENSELRRHTNGGWSEWKK